MWPVVCVERLEMCKERGTVVLALSSIGHENNYLSTGRRISPHKASECRCCARARLRKCGRAWLDHTILLRAYKTSTRMLDLPLPLHLSICPVIPRWLIVVDGHDANPLNTLSFYFHRGTLFSWLLNWRKRRLLTGQKWLKEMGEKYTAT